MDNYIEKAGKSIDDAIKFFLKRIKAISEDGPNRKYRKKSPAFPMLKLGNDAFYEFASFERTLECFVRDLLINEILFELFMIHDIESKWPDNKNYVYVRYSTEGIEEIFPFEFIFITKGKKIGVRYTCLGDGEAADLMKEYGVERILQIEWVDELTDYEESREEYDVITPADFF